MRKNKFCSKIPDDKQIVLQKRMLLLTTKQTYTKTRNLKHLNVKARYTKEFLDSHGWKDKEILIIDYYENVKIVKGKVTNVSKWVTFEQHYSCGTSELKKLPLKFIEIV